MKNVKLASALDDFEDRSNESGLKCSDPSRAKQSFKDECDINTIVRRFGITGQLPVGVRMPTYGDFTEVQDFQGAMNAIAQAREAFDQMPAHVRKRFDNDPQRFVEFCSDEGNREEAVKLGLVAPKVLDLVPAPAVVAAPAAPAAPVAAPAAPSSPVST